MSNKVTLSLLNQATEHASKGIMIQDTNRNVVFANHACGEITLRTKGDIVGRHCGDVFRCHTATGMPFTENLCPCVDVLTGRSSQNAREFLIYRGDGTDCWVKASASARKSSFPAGTKRPCISEEIKNKIFDLLYTDKGRRHENGSCRCPKHYPGTWWNHKPGTFSQREHVCNHDTDGLTNNFRLQPAYRKSYRKSPLLSSLAKRA